MADTAASSSSSSSSSSLPPKKHDVFLSFRGEDTRKTFISHLLTALRQRGIRTYIDNELRKGDDISDALTQAIKDSSIAVVIFSENYASSKWCLNELIQILWCKEIQGQLVIPIFYQIDPSHVRNQRETYREVFAKHERDFRLNQDRVNQWKQALFITANLAGWDSRTCRDESELIQNIVNDVQQKLNLSYPSSRKGLVGIDENCDKIERLLEKVPIIGIWGMGGIGKTTMAKALFDRISFKFESSCFLENVREEAERHGLTYVRNNLLFKLLREESFPHRAPNVASDDFVMRRLSCKKVFIVLDDVSSWKQLEYLAPYCEYLGPGSKVIITTRHKQLLVIARVNKIYEAQPLSHNKSVELFNRRAFHPYHPKIGYESLSQRVVHYAKGIPLVLVVLGSFLRSKTPKEWDSALSKLKKSPNEDILQVLQLSFDGLNYEEKEMFLDIAFFLKGEEKEYVITLLESFGFHARIGLETLVDRALITIDDSMMVRTHDLIKEMGYEIVRRECIKEPGRRSRLCDPEEVIHVLKNNTGTDAIEGIVLDLSKIRYLHLSIDTFKKMSNLRFLKFFSLEAWRSYKVDLSSGLESLSKQLRYLHWDGYPLESLPSTFPLEKLVELRLRNSQVKKLWDGVQDFVNLRRINLAGCKQLIELPDFSKAQNLQSVNLYACESLCDVHPSILSLHRLVNLNLGRCIKLKKLRGENPLKSLESIRLSWCFSLTEFSLSSEEIASLELETTRIEILDSSIGHLSKLKQFSLNGSRLKSLPINELCCLRSLEELRLSNCEQVIDKLKLQILFDALQFLKKLHLDGCRNLTELPNNIKHIPMLKVLSVKNCDRLQSLPELPPSIEELDATNCPSLKTITLSSEMEYSLSPEEGMMALTPSSSSIGYLMKLRKLRINVSSLMNFSIEQLCRLRSLKELTLLDCGLVIDKSKLHKLFDALCSLVDLYLGGCSNLYELPDNIGSLSSLYLLGLEGSNVEHLPSSIKHLLKLDYIYLTNCRRLRSLPELPPFTRYVKATGCSSLEVASPLTTSRPQRRYLLESLFLENCLKLEEHSLSCIEEYAYLSLKRAAYLNRTGDFCYPGRKIPEWVRYNQATEASSFITIELSSAVNNLLGFVFCSVLPQFSSIPNCQSYLKCQIYFEDGEEIKGKVDDMLLTELNSHHVFLWYDPIYSVCLLRELIEREDDQGIKGNPKLSFEFSVVSYDENYHTTKHDLIEACGVCPIYASEYNNFLQQMEFGLDLGSQKKRGCDNDEHSLCGIMEYASFSLERVFGNFQRVHISSPEMRNTSEGFLDKTVHSLSAYFELPYLDDLLGFIFCFVIPQFSSTEKNRSHSSCRCCLSEDFPDFEVEGIRDFEVEGPRGWHYSMTELNLDNVFQWYDPLFCEFILDQVRRRGVVRSLSFEFEFGDCLIKEWGIHPIYASKYNNFLQQKELKLEVGMKRPRPTCDEEELLTPTKKLKECSVQPVNIDELLVSLSELNLEFAKDSTLPK